MRKHGMIATMVVAAIFFSFSISALAADSWQRLDSKPKVADSKSRADVKSRMDNQQRRIADGIKSGELSKAEADVVQSNLNLIRENHTRMMADGKLTPDEEMRLHKMLDDNSNRISAKKHNVVKEAGTPAKDKIMDRITNQQKRIDQGIASGALTKVESDVVQANLNLIKDTRASMMADGKITPDEEKKLNGMLDRNSKMIQNKKANPVKSIK